MASNDQSPSPQREPGSQNYYDLLGITPQATDEEIKRAFRKTALRLRKCFPCYQTAIANFSFADPDKNPDPEAAAQFQAVDKAYKVLSDPKLN